MNLNNEKIAKTYHIGNSVIEVVAPKNVTEERKQEILKEIHRVGWSILKAAVNPIS